MGSSHARATAPDSAAASEREGTQGQNDKTNPTQQKKAMFLDERSSILGETKWVETTAVVIMATPLLR